jgi:hypothetical protein
MSEGATCDVVSEFSMRLEIGLKRGAHRDLYGSLGPGPDYRWFDLRRGINRDVPRDLITTWLRINQRHLGCIKQGRIRIIEAADVVAAI